jgi:hypothetical protein
VLILDQLVERRDVAVHDLAQPRPLIGRVLNDVLCSDNYQAADWYERAINARDPFAIVFAGGPVGSDFRQSARCRSFARIDEHAVSRLRSHSRHSGAP